MTDEINKLQEWLDIIDELTTIDDTHILRDEEEVLYHLKNFEIFFDEKDEERYREVAIRFVDKTFEELKQWFRIYERERKIKKIKK